MRPICTISSLYIVYKPLSKQEKNSWMLELLFGDTFDYIDSISQSYAKLLFYYVLQPRDIKTTTNISCCWSAS